MKCRLLFLFTAILFFSCNKKTKDDFIVHYIESNISDTLLTAQKLPIDVLNPTGIVSLDTFLILVQRHEEAMLRIYSSRSNQFLGAILQKGEGPDEVLLFNRLNQNGMYDGDAKLWIQSFATFMGLLNVNKSLEQNKTVFDKKYSFHNTRKTIFLQSNVVFNLNDSTFLLAKDPVRSETFEKNPNPFYVKLNYNTENVSDTLYYFNFSNIKMGNEPLFSGYQALKPDKSKVALFHTYMDAFTIIDLETGKKYQYGLSRTGLDPEFAMSRKKQIHYEACATDSLLFGLKKDEKQNGYLHIYDWDGNEKQILNLNAHVLFFSVDEQNKSLYCIDDEDQILKYDLKGFL